jgi:CheY-like chemotaxis protein
MKKVLIASQYKMFLERNNNLLKQRGFGLFTTTSGVEGLKLHQEHSFDLILSDFKLEDMGGNTFCSLIRRSEDSQHVPIILTCHNLPGSIETVEQSDATAMLLKPLDPIKLVETIGSYLGLQIGRSKRIVLNVKVTCKEHNLVFFCFSHDISNTGILFETEHQLALGTRVICQFTLPDSGRIESEAEVMRTMTAEVCENLYGVKFVNLPLSCRRAIDNFISATPLSVSRAKDISSRNLLTP